MVGRTRGIRFSTMMRKLLAPAPNPATTIRIASGVCTGPFRRKRVYLGVVEAEAGPAELRDELRVGDDDPGEPGVSSGSTPFGTVSVSSKSRGAPQLALLGSPSSKASQSRSRPSQASSMRHGVTAHARGETIGERVGADRARTRKRRPRRRPPGCSSCRRRCEFRLLLADLSPGVGEQRVEAGGRVSRRVHLLGGTVDLRPFFLQARKVFSKVEVACRRPSSWRPGTSRPPGRSGFRDDGRR